MAKRLCRHRTATHNGAVACFLQTGT